MKRKAQQYLDWLPHLHRLSQSYLYAIMYLEEGAEKGDKSAAVFSVSKVKDLQTSLAVVPKQNISDSFLIQGSRSIPTLTIAEIKTKLGDYLKQGDDIEENAVAEDNVKWEPYNKLLSSDRLKIFNDTYRGGRNFYGRGGVYLDKPGQFQTATVMCTKSWNYRSNVESWKVYCYSFQGIREISGPRVVNSFDSTPSSFYRQIKLINS